MESTTPTNVIPAWFEESRKRIADGIARITSSVSDIAQAYVEAIDRDPAFRDHLIEEMPGVPAGFWRSLERVGRNQLDGRILAGGVPYGNKLRNLPLSDQRTAIDGSISLLVGDGDHLAMRLDAMMPDQVEQVFARDHIRTLEEQRAWRESRSTDQRLRNDKSAPPVEIDKRRGCIHIGNVTIKASDLADYLRKLTE